MNMRSLLCFLVLVSTVTADCSSAMCEHGSCIDGDCKCDPNYTGADCSLPFETCEDGERTCFNGSECVRNNYQDPTTNTYKYYCDCSKAYGTSPFAGLQCEQAATSYCVEDGATSKYAFCTNGGTCVRVVVDGTPHPGCNCSEEFEGIHCQYVKGQAPAEDLGQPYQMVYPRGSSGDAEGVAVFIIVIICIGFIVGLGYVLYRKKNNDRKETTTSPEVTKVSAENPQAEII